MKKSTPKVRYFRQIEEFLLITLPFQMAQTLKFIFSNVDYGPTVYKIGVGEERRHREGHFQYFKCIAIFCPISMQKNPR